MRHRGTAKAYLEIAKLLLDQECVDVNRAGADGDTPLHRASAAGHLEVVNRANGDGTTSLYLEIVKLLLAQESADMHCTDKNGDTPWHVASAEGHLEVVKLLEEAGAVGGCPWLIGW